MSFFLINFVFETIIIYNMKKITTLLLLSIFIPASLKMFAQAPDFYTTNFNSGLPTGFKILDLDESEIKENYYRNVDIAQGWSINRIDLVSNYAAMSLSRVSEDGIQQSNWLITPKVAINSEKAFLRWDARSVLKAFPEKYRVMVSTTDNKSASFKEIASFDAEEYEWTTRLISLAEFKGQEIYVAFVCESTDKYILAIDNLTIGEISDEKIILSDNTPRFCGDDEYITASGRIFNAGTNLNWQAIITATENNETEFVIDKTFETNSYINFEFEVPVSVGKQSYYKVYAKNIDGSKTELLSDSIICSYFKRNLLVDKTTGTWCNNCPDGDVYMKPIKKRYAGSLVTINAHYNDPMACTTYFAGLNQWIFNLPTTITNRDRKTITNISYGKYEYDMFNSVLTEETIVQIDAEAMLTEDETSVDISSIVKFAKEIDNSQDTYKIGYALVENSVYQPQNYGYIQQNNTSLPKVGEFYLMPTYIPQDIMVFEDVVREGSTSFSGVDNSLPITISVGDEITTSHNIAIPQNVIDKHNLDAVLFIINKETDIIMNTVRVPCKEYTSIGNINNTNNDINVSITPDGLCNISFANEYSKFKLDVYSIDGKLLNQITGDSHGNSQIDLSSFKGLIIIKISTENHTIIQKSFIK